MLFSFLTLDELLIAIKGEFLFNIELLEAFLSGKEKYILLKSVNDIVVGEPLDIDDFYGRFRHNGFEIREGMGAKPVFEYTGFKSNVIANIVKDNSVDVVVPNGRPIERYTGAVIFREQNGDWKLYIPLTLDS